MAKGTRLDLVLVDRGLAPSRERARALILAGQVTVDGQVVSKAGAPVAAHTRVELAKLVWELRRQALDLYPPGERERRAMRLLTSE